MSIAAGDIPPIAMSVDAAAMALLAVALAMLMIEEVMLMLAMSILEVPISIVMPLMEALMTVERVGVELVNAVEVLDFVLSSISKVHDDLYYGQSRYLEVSWL